jgi:hypothetical protein
MALISLALIVGLMESANPNARFFSGATDEIGGGLNGMAFDALRSAVGRHPDHAMDVLTAMNPTIIFRVVFMRHLSQSENG